MVVGFLLLLTPVFVHPDKISTQALSVRAFTIGLIEQTLHINVCQASPHQRQPGFIRQSLHTDANQASLGRVATPTSTRPHRAEPLHQTLPVGASPTGLIGQSFRTNVNQALSGRAPHQRQPGLFGQSLHTEVFRQKIICLKQG